MKAWTVVKILKSFRQESVKRSEVYFHFGNGISVLGRPTHLPVLIFSILQWTSICLRHRRVSQSRVLWTHRASAVFCMLWWLSNKILSFSPVFKREAYCNGYVTLAGYSVPSMDLWINFKLRTALPTSRGCAGDGNKSLHTQFILFSGRRIKLISRSLALGIAGYVC